MATVINNPNTESGGGAIVVGVVVLLLLVAGFIFYGLRGTGNTTIINPEPTNNSQENPSTNVNVNVPGNASGTIQYGQ